MIIVFKPDATKQEIKHVSDKIRELGLKPMLSAGKERSILGVIGEEDRARIQPFEAYPGVESVVPIQKPYKFVSKEFKKETSVIKLGPGVEIGGEEQMGRAIDFRDAFARHHPRPQNGDARTSLHRGFVLLRDLADNHQFHGEFIFFGESLC